VPVESGFAGQISLIVNIGETTAEVKKTYQQISNIAKRFLNTHVYGASALDRDKQLSSAVRQQKPVVSAYFKLGITSSLAVLSAKRSGDWAAQPSNEGAFKKVVDRFF